MQDYVLPTYSVSLVVPSAVAIRESTFPVTVTAQYAFGGVVEGVAVVTFSKNYYGYKGNGQYGLIVQNLYTRVLNINSTSQTFQVDLRNDLQITQPYESVNVLVVFTESITRKQVSASRSFYTTQFAYDIVWSDNLFNTQTYSLNDTINVKATLKKQDGTLVRV